MFKKYYYIRSRVQQGAITTDYWKITKARNPLEASNGVIGFIDEIKVIK